MLKLHVRRTWDAALWQTQADLPQGALAVLVDWTIDPAPVDEGAPAEVRRAISRACAVLGPVAFRLFFDEGLSPSASVIRAPRPWPLLWAWERLTRRWAADVAIAASAEDAALMFGQHWSLQQAAALVLDGLPIGPAALEGLRRSRDWRGQPLPPGALLLVTPAVDGDGVLFAAASAAQLEAVIAALAAACDHQGVAFTADAEAE